MGAAGNANASPREIPAATSRTLSLTATVTGRTGAAKDLTVWKSPFCEAGRTGSGRGASAGALQPHDGVADGAQSNLQQHACAFAPASGRTTEIPAISG